MQTRKLFTMLAIVVIVTLTAELSFASESNNDTSIFDLSKNGFGVEFVTCVVGNSTFTREALTFNGKGNQPLTESQIVDVKFNIDRPSYDIGIFYRIKRFKFGIIPTSLIHNTKTTITDIPYNYKFEDKTWTLGHNEINADFYNVMYGEYYGMKAKLALFNLAYRLDWAQISGKSQTYKYPYGDEWYQSPTVLDEKTFDKKFAILSLGPKMTIDLKDIDIFKDPLKYFQKLGLDLSLLWDLPIGNTAYEGYSVTISLASEF